MKFMHVLNVKKAEGQTEGIFAESVFPPVLPFTGIPV